LAEILVLELGVFGRTLGAVGVERRDLDDAPHRQAKIPQTRLTIHGAGVAGNSVEGDHAGNLANRDAGARKEREQRCARGATLDPTP
jgi:hypothetical protein